jgi:hypothetical protein
VWPLLLLLLLLVLFARVGRDRRWYVSEGKRQ